MRKALSFILGLSAALAASSCAAEFYSVSVDMRQPMSNGVDLAGKTLGVVYVEQGNAVDTLVTKMFADGFAQCLEDIYFNGERAVNLYTVPNSADAVWNAKDTLVNLCVETNEDVVFLIEPPKVGNIVLSEETKSWLVPVNIHLDMYSSMFKKDTVFSYVGKTNLDSGSAEADYISKLKTPAMNAGYISGKKFDSEWKSETHTILAINDWNSDKWYGGLISAENMEWAKAMDTWKQLLDTKNTMKRACAEYNIAVACYIMGNMDTAIEWLNLADEDYVLTQSSTLRRRIINWKALR